MLSREVVEALVKRIRKLETLETPAIYIGTTDPATSHEVGDNCVWFRVDTTVIYVRASGAWVTYSVGGSGMTNPMTLLGDIITAAAAGVPKRLGIGAAGEVLTVTAGEPAWEDPAHDVLSATHLDTTVSAPNDQDVLTWDAGSSTWIAQALPASSNHDILSATHTDTTVSVPVDQDVLTWDNATGKWIAQAPPAAGPHTILSHSDADPTAPSDKDVLTWDNGAGEWKAAAIPAQTTIADDPLWDAAGDLAVGTGANTGGKLAIGSAGEVLTVVAGTPSWEPIPTQDHDHSGDVGDGNTFDAANLTSGASGDGQVLTSDGLGGAAWEDLPAAGNHDILSATHDDTTVSAPNDQDVLTWDDATSKWIAQAPAGGGATIYTSAYASPPAGPASGDLWLPSDGVSLYRYSGAAWVPWGEINALAGVANAPTTWVNQGTASVDSTYGGVYLTAPATAGNYNFRMQVKAAPATPYTITALIKPSIESVNFNGAGLVWRQSSDGKLVNAGFIWSSAMNFYIAKWSDPNTWAGNYIYPTSYHMGWPWIRLTDNGTNRIVSVSIDGRHWHQLHSVGRTDYLTANQVGFYVMTQSTYPVGALLLSWEEA